MQDSIRNDGLFKELSTVLEPIGLRLVDVRKNEHREATQVLVTITNADHTAGIDDCAKAHRILFPRLSLLNGSRAIDLEVSTPGIQRNFRDMYEFTLFVGRRCRIYDGSRGAWVEGIIDHLGDTDVVLKQARVEGEQELHDTYQIPHDHVHKAKLAYAWEDM